MAALVDVARRRGMNIGLAGAQGKLRSSVTATAQASNCGMGCVNALIRTSEAVTFYEKFGFREITSPRMLADGKVVGVSQLGQ
jgi:hypothetical protein